MEVAAGLTTILTTDSSIVLHLDTSNMYFILKRQNIEWLKLKQYFKIIYYPVRVLRPVHIIQLHVKQKLKHTSIIQ